MREKLVGFVDMPNHLEKLKSIWQECQIDLSEKKVTQKAKQEKEAFQKTNYLNEPSAHYKLDFED